MIFTAHIEELLHQQWKTPEKDQLFRGISKVEAEIRGRLPESTLQDLAVLFRSAPTSSEYLLAGYPSAGYLSVEYPLAGYLLAGQPYLSVQA